MKTHTLAMRILSLHLPTDGWWLTSSISRASFSGSKESTSSPATLEMTQRASCSTRGGMYVLPSSDSSPTSVTRTSWGRIWMDNTKPSWDLSTLPHSKTRLNANNHLPVSTKNLKFSKERRGYRITAKPKHRDDSDKKIRIEDYTGFGKLG